MNPALDISTAVDEVVPEHKMRCEAPQVHPGGGGVNVARVLTRLGLPVRAVLPTGGPTGERLLRLLQDEGVQALGVPIRGDTRESFTVREGRSQRELRFVLPGPDLGPAGWQACLDALAQGPAARWWIASGSLPPGVPVDFYARVARLARQAGALLVLDTSGEALRAALEEGVELVKPSLRELQELSGTPLQSLEAQRAAAGALVGRGAARAVALSLGAGGALWVSAQEALLATSPPVAVVSTVGAGDSFLAALVAALAEPMPPAQALARAVAAGAAALLGAGTALCDPAEAARLLPVVTVTALP